MHVPIPIMFLGLALMNVVGLWFANYFRLLIFLDTLATAVAGVYFGVNKPWGDLSGVIAGAAVGGITNVVTGWKYPAYFKFLHVNVLCGVAWGLVPILVPLPSPNDPETTIVLYIVSVGAGLGLLSMIFATPVRIWIADFNSDHILDQVSGSIWKNVSQSPIKRIVKIFSAEYLLSHCLDKILSTTVAVIYALVTIFAPEPATSLTEMYRDLMELLAAYYFVALAYVVKSLDIALKFDEMVLLLGPLGFFSVLMVVPGVLRVFLGG